MFIIRFIQSQLFFGLLITVLFLAVCLPPESFADKAISVRLLKPTSMIPVFQHQNYTVPNSGNSTQKNGSNTRA